jgi:hypothetical protein
MATLTVQSPAITGTTMTLNSAAASDEFSNNSKTYIIIYNNSGGTRTFDAVTTQVVESTLDVADRSFSVEDGTYTIIGPFSTSVYGTTVTIENWDTTPTGVSIMVFGF